MLRYRFANFIVSPQRRLLLRDGRELPLIPRYFDLLVLLIERRHQAVHRREIFDKVWTDVIVSDSALSQAIRTIRRTLGDDSREPRFVRTVSRHGYQFVFPGVVEEEDVPIAAGESAQAGPARETLAAPPAPAADAFEPLLDRVARRPRDLTEEEDRRDAAEQLHVLGTADALRRLGTRPGHAFARALLRDTRWNVPGAGEVPVLSGPSAAAVASELVRLRLRNAARIAARRWAGASAGGGLAGVVAGLAGGLLLSAAPASAAPPGVAIVLAVIGGGAGALGGAGVGAGLSVAEASARSQRALALVLGAAFGGAFVGAAAQWVGRWSLAALVGLRVEVGGTVEGMVIGAAAGLGYAIATHRLEGMAAPRGRRRLAAAASAAVLCGLAGLSLTLAGQPLVGGTVHAIARAAHGSQVSLAPLGRLIGEPDFGPLTQAILGFGEAAIFGLGLTLGLMRGPSSGRGPTSSPTSQESLTPR